VLVRALQRVIDLGRSAGVPPALLLKLTGLTDAALRDPDARVPVVAEVSAWQALAKRVPDPEFGVRGGAAVRARQLGLLGYVACFSGTLRDALGRLERYGRILTEAVEVRLHEDRPGVVLAISHPALGSGLPIAQAYRLAAVLQLTREITGRDLVPAEVTFAYPQPRNLSAHRQHFRCPLRFAAPVASIVFRQQDLDLPIVRADETLAGYLGEYANQVLASLVRGDTVRYSVRAAIWSLLGEGTPSLGRVAAALDTRPRTLQRRLAAEGTSLQREIQEIRKTMAIALVRDRGASIGEVAFLLGYAEPSAFYRSFRRWTGSTPRQFRGAA
jgi:AraC-like DNA-binding protein